MCIEPKIRGLALGHKSTIFRQHGYPASLKTENGRHKNPRHLDGDKEVACRPFGELK